MDALKDRTSLTALLAAAVILGGFGLIAYLMPRIMLWLAELSPFASALAAILFVGAFFLVFWLRGRKQERKDE